MKVKRGIKPLIFRDGDDEVSISYDNEGDPFREGVSLAFASTDAPQDVRVLLDVREVAMLRDRLNEFLGEAATAG